MEKHYLKSEFLSHSDVAQYWVFNQGFSHWQSLLERVRAGIIVRSCEHFQTTHCVLVN